MESEEPFMKAVASNVLLFILITGLAGAVDFKDFKHQFEEKRGLLTGLFCQFILLPLTGFLVVKGLKMEEVTGITLLVATSSPGGSYSNWWCSMFNADLALSVALTTMSTLCSTFMLPLNLSIYARACYGHSVQLNWRSLVVAILVVLAAVASGLLASARLPEKRTALLAAGNVAGLALIALGLASSYRSDEPVLGKGPVFYMGVALPPAIGMVTSLTLAYMSGLSKPQCIAVSIETCYQNTGIALTVALSSFQDSLQHKAAAVPVFYMGTQFALLSLLSFGAWKLGWTYAPQNLRLDKCLIGNFQPSFRELPPRIPPRSLVASGAGDKESLLSPIAREGSKPLIASESELSSAQRNLRRSGSLQV